MSETRRVLRVLEYVGTDERIMDTLSRGEVSANGMKHFGKDLYIKSGLIGFGGDSVLESDKSNLTKAIDFIYSLINSEENYSGNDLLKIIKILEGGVK